jgi:hypothetical protein
LVICLSLKSKNILENMQIYNFFEQKENQLINNYRTKFVGTFTIQRNDILYKFSKRLELQYKPPFSNLFQRPIKKHFIYKLNPKHISRKLNIAFFSTKINVSVINKRICRIFVAQNSKNNLAQ